MNPKLNIHFQGGLGVLPQKLFGFWGRKWYIPVPFWVTVLQYPLPPPALPFKKNSLQIYTDLKNGPVSWKKVWNQTKVWKFWSLLIHLGFCRWILVVQNTFCAGPCGLSLVGLVEHFPLGLVDWRQVIQGPFGHSKCANYIHGRYEVDQKGCSSTQHFTGAGQKLCTNRVVLPVADNIFKWKFFASVLLVAEPKVQI